MISLAINGDKALERSLNRIGPGIASKVIKGAASTAMNEFRKAARRHIKALPFKSGQDDYARSLKKKAKLYKNSGAVVVVVGPKSGERDAEGRVWANLMHLIESGTKEHRIPARIIPQPDGSVRFGKIGGIVTGLLRGGILMDLRHPGTRAYKPMETAATASKSKVLSVYRTKLRTNIPKEVAKEKARQQRKKRKIG